MRAILLFITDSACRGPIDHAQTVAIPTSANTRSALPGSFEYSRGGACPRPGTACPPPGTAFKGPFYPCYFSSAAGKNTLSFITQRLFLLKKRFWEGGFQRQRLGCGFVQFLYG